MKSIRDNRLPREFQRWLNKAAPIPNGVHLLRRTIDLRGDVSIFLAMGVLFGMVPALLLVILIKEWESISANLGMLGCIIAVALGCASVPLLLLRRAWVTYGASIDDRRGQLRQGVFIGPEGVLVRMTPNQNFPIAWSEFVAARRYPPEESRSIRRPLLIIGTTRGEISFFAERLLAGYPEIHSIAQEVRSDWKPQYLRPRKDRVLRDDLVTQSRSMRGIAYIIVPMFLIMGSIGAVMVLDQNSPLLNTMALLIVIGIVLVVAASINLVVRGLQTARYYRCPQCGATLPRYEQAMPAIHYYCESCNIEWDTGANENETG
ncbi:MAG: hypothetical protein IT366_19775 [Candidatus Hydrogenedentes bacterium]|nr:hypothetical protein [Candidatus Hydrogenedentota bacterium]